MRDESNCPLWDLNPIPLTLRADALQYLVIHATPRENVKHWGRPMVYTTVSHTSAGRASAWSVSGHGFTSNEVTLLSYHVCLFNFYGVEAPYQVVFVLKGKVHVWLLLKTNNLT